MRRPVFFRCSLTVLLFGLWNAPAWAIGTTPPSWKPRETVTSTGAVINEMAGADRSLAYDHFGNPGIAYYDLGNQDLRYARRVPGVGWVHAAIDSVNAVGQYTSLAFDRYERPAISYYETTNDDLKYARFTGSAWQIETVDSVGNVGEHTSLAFDLLGRPAIAYRNATNGSLKYVHDTDGDFSLLDETPVTVVAQFNEGYTPSLVFDPLNRPMIAHTDVTNFDLRFSVQEPGIGWITTTVDNGSTSPQPSLAIDPDTGLPAIAYSDSATDFLRYAAWNGAAWGITTADSTTLVGSYFSLAFDPGDGNPAIAYLDDLNQDLMLAWHDGAAWQTQTVNAVGNVGHVPSLAFNEYGNGFPSIAYVGSGGHLFFIEDPPATAVPEPASVMLLVLGLALGAGWRNRRLGR